MSNKAEGYVDIIRRYTSVAPVDVRNLAKALGMRVVETQLKDDISGAIERIDDRYRITVNMLHTEKRKRFTIAHEIGHFILHGSLIGEGIYDNAMYRSDQNRMNRNISDAHETEANKFAATILMPKRLISDLKDQGVTGATDLASKLDVSVDVMNIRLGNK